MKPLTALRRIKISKGISNQSHCFLLCSFFPRIYKIWVQEKEEKLLVWNKVLKPLCLTQATVLVFFHGLTANFEGRNVQHEKKLFSEIPKIAKYGLKVFTFLAVNLRDERI